MPRRNRTQSGRSSPPSGYIHRAAAVIAGLGWAWAAGLLVLREHWVLLSFATASAPPGWGIVALPLDRAFLLATAATLLAWSAFRAGRKDAAIVPPPTAWLLAAWIIPLGDFLRLAGFQIPPTLFEPLLLAGITGAAAGTAAARLASQPDSPSAKTPLWAIAAIAAMTFAAGAWWLFQGVTAFNDYLLGYCDFAQYGWRVANTWTGRGFMMETPGLPAFWDHFCPAVALLAPLWGMTHDARLYIVLQAACLSLPAIFIFHIVRRWGGSGATACIWAAAYLIFPAVGQLNLNYSYGWHPASVAMVLFFAALLALVSRHTMVAALLAAFACTWQDYVAVNLGWFAFVMALVAWWDRRFRAEPASPAANALSLPHTLPPWGWLLAAGAAALYFFSIYQLTPFSHEETARFGNLGSTPTEILLSPFLRAKEFWGNVFRPRAVIFVLALTVPLALSNLWRGWTVLLGAALPLGVLVAWDYPPATSIAFQYHTLTLPVLFAAALSGATTRAVSRPTRSPEGAAATTRAPSSGHGLWIGGIAALAACFTASLTLGAMPWSSPTTAEVALKTYGGKNWHETVVENRRVGSAGNDSLNRIVDQVGREDAVVLATGRIAAHLLMVKRLEPVGTARDRWEAFAAQAGQGRSAVELFDWVVLDLREHFYQSERDMQFIASAAAEAGFKLVSDEHDILLFRAPE